MSNEKIITEEIVLTLERLKEVLFYDPDTGIFIWLKNRGSKIKKGDKAGCINPFGYIRIKVFGRLYMAHVLAWFYMKEEMPILDIDHINRIKNDNRWNNLRLANRSNNTFNKPKNKNNTSGYKGVSYHKIMKKYRAKICVNGKHIILGYKDTPEEASILYIEASIKYAKEFSIFMQETF